MSCFHEKCGNSAKFWCQTCNRKFCDDCIGKPHYRNWNCALSTIDHRTGSTSQPSGLDRSMPLPPEPEPEQRTALHDSSLTPHSSFQCGHAANWFAIVGTMNDIVICHFCDQYEKLGSIEIHCRTKRHSKKVCRFRLEQP